MVQARHHSVSNPYITPPNSESFRIPNLNIVISNSTMTRDMSPCSMNFILRKGEHNSYKTKLYSSQTRLSFTKQQLFQTIVNDSILTFLFPCFYLWMFFPHETIYFKAAVDRSFTSSEGCLKTAMHSAFIFCIVNVFTKRLYITNPHYKKMIIYVMVKDYKNSKILLIG